MVYQDGTRLLSKEVSSEAARTYNMSSVSFGPKEEHNRHAPSGSRISGDQAEDEIGQDVWIITHWFIRIKTGCDSRTQQCCKRWDRSRGFLNRLYLGACFLYVFTYERVRKSSDERVYHFSWY